MTPSPDPDAILADLNPEQREAATAFGAHSHRAITLTRAYEAHPERFVRRPPTPPEVPTAVWINPPATKEEPPQ